MFLELEKQSESVQCSKRITCLLPLSMTPVNTSHLSTRHFFSKSPKIPILKTQLIHSSRKNLESSFHWIQGLPASIYKNSSNAVESQTHTFFMLSRWMLFVNLVKMQSIEPFVLLTWKKYFPRFRTGSQKWSWRIYFLPTVFLLSYLFFLLFLSSFFVI